MVDVHEQLAAYGSMLHEMANEIRSYAMEHIPRPERSAAGNIAIQVGLMAMAIEGLAADFKSLGTGTTSEEVSDE